MRLVCPACGGLYSAEAWANDADARQCLRIVGELPGPVAGHVLAYLALFRPQSGRGLRWAKALRLLSELQDEIRRPHIQWDRQPARPNAALAWGRALERVVARPPKRLPLKSHGYLKAIAYEAADEMSKEAESSKLKAERKGNTGAKHRPQGEPVKVDFDEMRRQIRKGRKGSGK